MVNGLEKEMIVRLLDRSLSHVVDGEELSLSVLRHPNNRGGHVNVHVAKQAGSQVVGISRTFTLIQVVDGTSVEHEVERALVELRERVAAVAAGEPA